MAVNEAYLRIAKEKDMINTIILDIGNVLAHFRWDEYLRDCGYDDETFDKIARATVKSELWSEWDRGAKSEEDLMLQSCRREPSVEKEITEFFKQFKEWVREYDYSADFIQKLKENGYQVYLLSNYSKNSFRYLKENFKFYQHVDGGVISYEVHHIKPEPEIYEDLIRKYQFNPEEAVFLDDIQANLDGARRFGIHTVLVTDFSKALEELRVLGVRI
jgi:putative hydrolase of the HAD superfamily